VPFVVRDDAAAPDILVALPFPTYQAYNEYPKDKNTGASLYYAWENGQIHTEDKAATKVSFERRTTSPASPRLDLDTSFAAWVERWAEENGRTVGYADSADCTPARSTRPAQGLIFPGHDEYWSIEMRDALDRALAAGVSVASSPRNNVYCASAWRTAPDRESATRTATIRAPRPPTTGPRSGARSAGRSRRSWRGSTSRR